MSNQANKRLHNVTPPRTSAERKALEFLDSRLPAEALIVANGHWHLHEGTYNENREVDAVVVLGNKIFVVELKNWDCVTNIYFNLEEWVLEYGKKKYGKKTEYRPNPIGITDDKKFEIYNKFLKFRRGRSEVYHDSYIVFTAGEQNVIDRNAKSYIYSQEKFLDEVIKFHERYFIRKKIHADPIDHDEFLKFVEEYCGVIQRKSLVVPNRSSLDIIFSNGTEQDLASGDQAWLQGELLDSQSNVVQFDFLLLNSSAFDNKRASEIGELFENLSATYSDRALTAISAFEFPLMEFDVDNNFIWFLYPRYSSFRGQVSKNLSIVEYLESGDFDLGKKVSLCLELCEKLVVLHDSGFHHRAICAESVGIREYDGSLFIGRFEVIKDRERVFRDVTMGHSGQSTRADLWVPPEYHREEEYQNADHGKSDLYSAALVICNILSDDPLRFSDFYKNWNPTDGLPLSSETKEQVRNRYPGLLGLLENALVDEISSRVSLSSFIEKFSDIKSESAFEKKYSEPSEIVGRIVEGNYLVERSLSFDSSRFAVFCATDQKFDHRVVLKYCSSGDDSESLRKEVENIKAVRSLSEFKGELENVMLPRVVNDIDRSRDLNVDFFVREHFDLISSNPVLDFDSVQIVSNLINVLKFVRAIHAEGMGLRDLCHTNVQWGRDGKLVYLDLGSVRDFADRSGGFEGKEDYLPPLMNKEDSNVEKKNYVKRRDIYSAVLTSFHWVFGQSPWGTGRPISASEIQISFPQQSETRFSEEEYSAFRDFYRSFLGKDAFDTNNYTVKLDIVLESSMRLLEKLQSGYPTEILNHLDIKQHYLPDDLSSSIHVETSSSDLVGLVSFDLQSSRDLFESVYADLAKVPPNLKFIQQRSDFDGNDRFGFLTLYFQDQSVFSDRDNGGTPSYSSQVSNADRDFLSACTAAMPVARSELLNSDMFKVFPFSGSYYLLPNSLARFVGFYEGGIGTVGRQLIGFLSQFSEFDSSTFSADSDELSETEFVASLQQYLTPQPQIIVRESDSWREHLADLDWEEVGPYLKKNLVEAAGPFRDADVIADLEKDLLGSGAMGSVFRESYGGDNVIKICHTDNVSEIKWNREIDNYEPLKGCTSDGFLKVFRKDIRGCLIFQSPSGRTLRERWKNKEHFSHILDLLNALGPFLNSMEFATSRGVFPTDIDASNILVADDDSRFIQIDLGPGFHKTPPEGSVSGQETRGMIWNVFRIITEEILRWDNGRADALDSFVEASLSVTQDTLGDVFGPGSVGEVLTGDTWGRLNDALHQAIQNEIPVSRNKFDQVWGIISNTFKDNLDPDPSKRFKDFAALRKRISFIEKELSSPSS